MPPQNFRILIVEDDPEDAELLIDLLVEAEPTVSVAHEQLLTPALRRLKTEDVDLVFLDLSLPDSWGLETLRRFRRSYPQLPVVLMTGATTTEFVSEAEREGARAYLFKHEMNSSRIRDLLQDIG